MDYTNNTRDSDGNNIFYKSKAKDIQYGDGSLENKISSIDNSIGTLETNVTTNGRNIAAMNTRLVNVETAVNAIDPNKFVKKTGDTLTGQLQRGGVSSSWVNGRENAFIRQPTVVSGAGIWSPMTSVKSENGSWEMGAYSNADQFNLAYISDENYNKGQNAASARYIFHKDGSLEANSFKGNLQGKATSAGVADKATTADNATAARVSARTDKQILSGLVSIGADTAGRWRRLGYWKEVHCAYGEFYITHSWSWRPPFFLKFVVSGLSNNNGVADMYNYKVNEVLYTGGQRLISKVRVISRYAGTSPGPVYVDVLVNEDSKGNAYQYAIQHFLCDMYNICHLWVDEGFKLDPVVPSDYRVQEFTLA